MSIPLKDALLLPFSANMDERLGSHGEVYHVPPERAAEYHDRHAAYVAAHGALMAARAEGTWSRSMRAARDAARAELLAIGREIYSTVQASGSISEADKVLLGVRVRDRRRTRIGRPTTPPAVRVARVDGSVVTLEVFDAASRNKRGKPAGAVSASIYSFVGEDYPSDLRQWRFHGAATKPRYSFTPSEAAPPASRVWIRAEWVTRRGLTGPASEPISTHLQFPNAVAGLKVAA